VSDVRIEFVSDEDQLKVYFDPVLQGLRATCEGGEPASGVSKLAGRETYIGLLTGRWLEEGDPPWRWLELRVDQRTPDSNVELGTMVWCEESFVFLEGDVRPPLPPRAPR